MTDYKKFSKKLYDENDNIAKLVAIDYLESTGFYKLQTPLDEQEESYKKKDFDIILLSTKQKVSVEVEKKLVWVDSCSWQGWPTIDVPTRKNKSESDLFVMVNKSNDTIAITTMKNVLNSPISAKKTIYTNNENFFNVDLDKFKFYCKSSGVWKLI